MQGPERMLGKAALRINLEIVEEEPYVLDDSEICSEELAEDASLNRERRFLPGRPIHDHPGGWHEIGEEVGVGVVVRRRIGGVDDADGAVNVDGSGIHVGVGGVRAVRSCKMLLVGAFFCSHATTDC
jgi:hypothetical protein